MNDRAKNYNKITVCNVTNAAKRRTFAHLLKRFKVGNGGGPATHVSPFRSAQLVHQRREQLAQLHVCPCPRLVRPCRLGQPILQGSEAPPERQYNHGNAGSLSRAGLFARLIEQQQHEAGAGPPGGPGVFDRGAHEKGDGALLLRVRDPRCGRVALNGRAGPGGPDDRSKIPCS